MSTTHPLLRVEELLEEQHEHWRAQLANSGSTKQERAQRTTRNRLAMRRL